MALKNLPKRLWDRGCIEADLAVWQWHTSPLQRAVRMQANRTVLFCDLMTMLSTAKVEALFAAALGVRGVVPVVLLKARDPVIMRVFSVCSETRFVFLDDYLSENIWQEAMEEAGRLLGHAPDLEALADLEVHGFRTGRNVLSRVVRGFRVGCLDPAKSEHMTALRNVLAESLAVSRAASNMLETLAPDKAIFLEKGYTPAGEIYDACLLKGVDTVQWLGAPQLGHLLFKRYTLATRADHPFSLGDDSWEQIRRMPWGPAEDARVLDKIASHYQTGAWYNRQQLQVGKRIMPREEVRERLGVGQERRLAVVFAHILYDATFFYGSSLYPDYEQWLVETVRSAIANPELDWVVKVHPVNVWRSRMDRAPMEQLEARVLAQEFGTLPSHVSLMPADTEINTYSLFSAIDFGLTVRGTIGMELPCFGVPVVTAGTGRYSGRGFTIDPPDQQAYRQLLATLHERPVLAPDQVELARKYAYGAFFLRPYPLRSFTLVNDARSFGVAALQQSVAVDRDAALGAIRDGDLADIADFILDGRREDLLLAATDTAHVAKGESDT